MVSNAVPLFVCLPESRFFMGMSINARLALWFTIDASRYSIFLGIVENEVSKAQCWCHSDKPSGIPYGYNRMRSIWLCTSSDIRAAQIADDCSDIPVFMLANAGAAKVKYCRFGARTVIRPSLLVFQTSMRAAASVSSSTRFQPAVSNLLLHGCQPDRSDARRTSLPISFAPLITFFFCRFQRLMVLLVSGHLR